MRYQFTKSLLRMAAIGVPALFAGGVAMALPPATVVSTGTVNLTATRQNAVLPDGNTVPMWAYCLNGICGTSWSPGPTIVVPITDGSAFGSLTISLTNNLPVNTSIVILGQVGGDMGASLPRGASPTGGTHATQALTWPGAGCNPATLPATVPPCTDPTFTPAGQPARALAFGVEAAGLLNTASTDKTHTYSWTHLRPGTYLYETGSLPSLQAPMGLYGVLVVTKPPVSAVPGGTGAPGDAYPNKAVTTGTTTTAGALYDADVALLFSEIDPRQNIAVDAAAGVNADPLKLFNDASCSLATPCYPPAVNYAPTYFLVNGQTFDPTQPQNSGFPVSDNAVLGGHLLVRMVNAGLRTHVPTIVGQSVSLIGEDGNFAPGLPKRQSHVLMAAGKTYDAFLFDVPSASGAYTPASFPVFDRSLSLTSGNLDHQTVLANSGMMGFIAVQPVGTAIGGTGGTSVPAAMQATANNDVFATAINTPFNGNVLTNDVNVVTAAVAGTATSAGGLISFSPDGSFAYTPPSATFVGPDSFTYTGNGNPLITATAKITVGTNSKPVAVADVDAAATSTAPATHAFISAVASLYKASAPGVLANDTASDGTTTVGLTAVLDSVGSTCKSVVLNGDGSFTAVPAVSGQACTFKYHAQNELGAISTSVDATVAFTAGSNLNVIVKDTQDTALAPLDDYSWVIEEDGTFYHDPTKPDAVDTLATNFHHSYMPIVASGCTGANSCGDAQSIAGVPVKGTAAARPRSLPSDVKLDPKKRYFISILPGDADQGDAQYNQNGTVTVKAFGHAMGGVTIPALAAAQTTWPDATVLVPRNPLPPAQLSVIVFEDNNPTNGGVDDNEPGLGGFTINLYDTRGSSGDPAGLMTYDLSAMPFTNSLANQIDSATVGTAHPVNLCPLTTPSGTIITCPALDSAGNPSPLAGMALIKNINPGRYDVWATPGADRAVKGETWVQVSTLEGTHANDTFIKPGEPGYWQEFGPPGFHSFIGFINPAHIAAVNKARGGTASVTGRVPSLHMDRPRPTMASLNNSCASTSSTDPSCRATLSATTCYVAVNETSGTGATVALTTCDQYGNFKLDGVPAGQQELVIWDQWLDQIIAYKALTVAAGATVNAGDIPVFSWFTRIEQSAYQDLNGNGVRDVDANGNYTEPGVSQIPMNIRFRDGSISNFLSTDSKGSVTANELFPLFNWYVLESDTTRYTGTGVMTAYDAGGQPDTATTKVTDLKGAQQTRNFRGVLRSAESDPLPALLQVPGSTYTPNSTLRIDSGATLTEGTQGFINQTTVVDWGKRPYVPGENGGITGMVYYASTRGFDDPSLEVQFSWEPGVAGVPVNLYQEVTNVDGSVTRVLVDQTTTWSWDAAAANLHCPGDNTTDPFVAVTLRQAIQKRNPGMSDADAAAIAATQCYDGQHSFNQVQPTVYDGRYKFPSAACQTPGGTFIATNGQTVHCATILNPANDPAVLSNKPSSVIYPAVMANGNYVVELVVPTGYDIVKEEDKNILIGDTYIAPFADTQFMGVGNIFIVPDQATLNDANVPGGNLASAFPPCVGAGHVVPDYLTLFPDSGQIAPYAGQSRPLCDHKEVGVGDQGQGGADFQLFTQTPIAGHISGIMLNDAAAEFDPYNPAFLEKASLPNAPISVRDYNGVEIQRVYNDRYGTFNNLVPSTWEANIPNPSGYAPNMLTYCMNDPGPIADPAGALDPTTADAAHPNGKVRMVVDPMYNPMFSNFCYNWPSMPGITTYLDTPVLPVSAYASASSYEPVDCAYPTNTPAIYRVDGTGATVDAKGLAGKSNVGPFVDVASGSTRLLTITALGDVQVANPAYEGPNAAPDATHPTVNQPKIQRHYGFGGTAGIVTINGVLVPTTNWSDASITLTVPTTAKTGELVITTADGKKSVDTVTVNIVNSSAGGYRKPIYVAPPVPGTSGASALAHPIQDAIDAAHRSDLIIVDAGNYSELVVMDRPVRLQGVGAAATVINATKYPNQKTEQWRTRINGLFGLDNQGNTLPGDPAVDPLPGQEITGGILQLEPSVLATEEGAGITVVAKGLRPDGLPLRSSGSDCNLIHNFRCATSRIDGLSITGGDAGGGIYVNGWAHGLEISNNRVFGNAGPFAGGVRIGQPYLEGQALSGNFSGLAYDEDILVHNNAITNNGTVEGNAAAGATAAAAGGAGGGLSICAGSDGYKVTGNWVCGNYSSSDGGGIGHIGLSNRGLIQGNKILFNESYNQSGPQFGGGLVIEGEGASATALSLGTGNVTVDQNLIQGNFARAGSGGGIRLQSVNGAELTINGLGRWSVDITNNMIVNNVAGWAGAGISLADTIDSYVIGNTIVSNDSTGIAGNLFNTQVSSSFNTGPTTAVPSPAGISSEATSAPLLAALPDNNGANGRNANRISKPHLVNDIVWHNRSFFFNMASGAAQLSPSNTWANTSAPPAALGAPAPADNGCVPLQEKYWDVGVVGDTSAASLNPAFARGNTVLSTTAGTPNLTKVYCNASRALPGLQFEPGTPFQPAFNISVAATLDESGNFVDLHFGPLSLQDQATGTVFNGDYHLAGPSGLAYNTGSVPEREISYVRHDYDGDTRPQAQLYDKGADEIRTPAPAVMLSATSLSFSTLQGTPAATQTITVTNIGDANLTNIVVSKTGSAFAQTNNCTGSIGFTAGSNSCTITVSFTATNVGNDYNGTLSITDNAAPSPQRVSLSGAVVARSVRAAFSTPNPTFWNRNQTGANFDKTFTLTANSNNNAPLAISSIPTVSGNFAIVAGSNTCTAALSLAAGGTCQLKVRHTTAGGTGTLSVQTNTTNPASGVVNFSLQGNGG